MIVRIVRLSLRPDSLDAFHVLFASSCDTIRQFPGCLRLELLEDVEAPTVRTTYSLWESAEALDAYRQSAYFNTVWRQTKPMFASPAVAHSYQSLLVV
jgi:quinol monooxygenase YgiN